MADLLLKPVIIPDGDWHRACTRASKKWVLAETGRRRLKAQNRRLRVALANAQESHSCDTCDNQRVGCDEPKNPWCRYLTKLAGGKTIYCYDVDQGCNAFKAKAETVERA